MRRNPNETDARSTDGQGKGRGWGQQWYGGAGGTGLPMQFVANLKLRGFTGRRRRKGNRTQEQAVRQRATGKRRPVPAALRPFGGQVPFEWRRVRFVGDATSGGEGFLLRSKQMRGDFAKVPDDAEPGQQLERVIGDVDFPPEEALASGSHVVMVIVVPAFSEGEDGEKPVVAAGVRGFVAARAKEMRERIDGEGIVPEEHGAQAETPEEQRPAADEPENHGESYRRDHVVLVQPAELGKFGEVADVVEAGLVVLV